MEISIFGLGYVGCVGLGCFYKLGHRVVGVDVNPTKVNLINAGKASIVEKDIDELIKKGVTDGKIKATMNTNDAVLNTDIGIICVGTPNDVNGHLNLSYIDKVAEEIGMALRDKESFFTIAIRSTVLPGTHHRIAKIISEVSRKKINDHFAIVSNPEFLREGSAVDDFLNPPHTILASDSQIGMDKMRELYEGVNGEVIVAEIGVAEMIKLLNNSYHALKVVFGNEVGRICKKLNIDSHKLIDLFSQDQVLNISPKYFKPGFAYGGSCLPKDLKALNTIAHDNYVNTPVLANINRSNEIHIDHIFDLIMSKEMKNIGLYGLSFKGGTDDLRYSPALEIAERLIGKGMNVKIYDENINLSKLMGKNKDFLYSKLPHINQILEENIEDFISCIELVIIVNQNDKVQQLKKLISSDQLVVDLSRVENLVEMKTYEGICW